MGVLGNIYTIYYILYIYTLIYQVLYPQVESLGCVVHVKVEISEIFSDETGAPGRHWGASPVEEKEREIPHVFGKKMEKSGDVEMKREFPKFGDDKHPK